MQPVCSKKRKSFLKYTICIDRQYKICKTVGVLKDTEWLRGEIMNIAKLEYEMKIRNVTRRELYEMLGISRSAFYSKCNGLSEFTRGEIQKIVDFLQLETPVDIFFDSKVS